MTPERLCVFCRHWWFDGGSPGFSEMTPGSDASMDCAKGCYTAHRLDDISSPDGFRAIIRKAESCKHYSEAKT